MISTTIEVQFKNYSQNELIKDLNDLNELRKMIGRYKSDIISIKILNGDRFSSQINAIIRKYLQA
jgi:hypothetical protein